MIRARIWLLVLAIFLIILNKYSPISKIRDDTAVFLQKQFHIILYKITNYPKLVLLQKNKQTTLEQENIKLKKQLEEYSLLLKEQSNSSSSIKELNELKEKQYSNYKIIIARAIIDTNYLINSKLLIDKGKNKNIAIGSAVINKEGLIGQVFIVNDKSSQVKLITNPEFKIFLQNSRTHTKMLAQGIGENQLQIKYLSKNDPIKVGDILSTTGLDDIFPANIPVAKVINIFYENNGFNAALCSPITNTNNIQYVSVLNNDN